MINSLIDCHKRKIIINRVLINNNNNQELLVNPVQIKEATIHHFQTCAGGINMRKEIPQQWQQQYSPKSNINPDIYNTLMDLPSLNEWYNIIKNLPNDKAAGPSGITNKMIKYLDIYNNEVDLNFGNEQIKIQPKKYSESIRILVIIPRIEYHTQLTFLTKKECDNISSPFRQLFKHKINLSTSAPNAIVNNRMIYNYRNLYEVQLQSKITNFYIQLNDQKLLGNITDIHLKQIQHNEWLHKSPLIEWPYNTPQCRHYSSFIPSMITLCHSNKFTFQ
ncbi:3390_t:CDS:2, partial [Entrophospora sp. SA101]